jgi:chemotaxis protein methyltransferase CheR
MHDPGVDIETNLLLEAIYHRYNYDFRGYSRASVKRRVLQAVSKFGLANVSQLIERVMHDDGFFPKLLQYLTIQVSEMFRDPEFFRLIRTEVVPHLRTYPSLKIWVAGCSAGEEVYSYAILLAEAGLLNRSVIYATDISPEALEKAEMGIYPAESLPLFTSNYQKAGGTEPFSKYYDVAYERAKFDAALRRNVVFADHSLATDNVFSETQLISCRNVLIYFDRALQDRALGLFYESLSHRGFLGLGSKESIRFSAFAEAFEPFGGMNIFRKVGP